MFLCTKILCANLQRRDGWPASVKHARVDGISLHEATISAAIIGVQYTLYCLWANDDGRE
jgi:hypothetical protein